jgi:mRNA-degrading endonuclease RelE of RelBE toxin-antitoxin system
MVGLISEYPTDTGVALDGRWEGARRVHCANDTYRIIWEIDDEREAIIILRIGKKSQRGGRTIYDLPRPPWPPEQKRGEI